MTEILTESFCERCGTRYTFESARPKTRLKGVKVLSRGLKNFVLSDDTSIDEAMAAARSETDREATSHQLDAFHETFNFCMSCRQYTCPNCWNETEARCLSCAPLALPEAPAAFDHLTSLRAAGLSAEPTPGNGSADHGHAETEPIKALGQPGAIDPSATQIDVAASPPAPTDTPPGPESMDPAGKAVHQTASLLRRFRPGQNVDAEVEAYERQRTDAEARDAEPETESEPEPQAAAAADVVEQPTWRMTAPDAPGATPPGRAGEGNGTVVPLQDGPSSTQVSAKPQWPARPEWPAASSTPAPGLPFLGRPATPQGGIDALWAASNEELVAAPPAPGRPAANGIQPCVSCGLSLSASARFCRRCGTLQGR